MKTAFAQVTEEGLDDKSPLLKLDIPDEELVGRIERSISSGRKLYNEVKDRAETNVKYWKAQQIDASKLAETDSKEVNNIVFRNMETMLPVITKETPQVRYISSAKDFDRKMEKISINRWEVEDKMLEKNRLAVRANFLRLLGVIKYKFDPETNDIVWEFVKTEQVILDEKASDIDNLGWVAEYVNSDTVAEVIAKFPKSKSKLLKSLNIAETNSERLGSKLNYVEFSTPEFIVWKCRDVILDKAKNPNWDWGGETVDEMGNTIPAQPYNLFNKPRVPYIFFQTFTLGESMYSDTSLIEQTLTLQDGLNKRKRQIDGNADQASGTLVGSGDYISKDEFAKINDQPKLKIWLEQGDASRGVARINGNQLAPFVFQDMVHSEGAMDNIWGTHSITRGEQGPSETATAKVLQQRQDYGRIDDIVKAYEDFNEQYYQALFQMMLVHYTEPHIFSFEDEDDLEVSRDEIIKAHSKRIKVTQNEVTGQEETEEESEFKPPVIMVKRGSTLPTDDVSKRAEALELWGSAGISPIDLYQKLDWPNPHEAAWRLFLWQKQPEALFPEFANANAGQPPIPQGVVEDYEAIKQGQYVPPNDEVSNPQTATAHIEGHNKIIDTPEWQELSPEIQQLYLDHVKSELEIAKQVLQQSGGQMGGGEVSGVPTAPGAVAAPGNVSSQGEQNAVA
jgi:hypothetical protein